MSHQPEQNHVPRVSLGRGNVVNKQFYLQFAFSPSLHKKPSRKRRKTETVIFWNVWVPARATSHLVRLTNPRLRTIMSFLCLALRHRRDPHASLPDHVPGLSGLHVLCARPPHVQKTTARSGAMCASCGASAEMQIEFEATRPECVRGRDNVCARAGMGGVGRVMASLRRKHVHLGTRSDCRVWITSGRPRWAKGSLS
jgi:hypothetical protein